MRLLRLLPTAALAFALGAGSLPARAQPPPAAHTLSGDFCLHPRFHSRFLPDDRDVLIFLPPGYNVDRTTRYPVLYLHDGQNLFDGATAFIPGHEWRVDETATALIRSQAITPLIIVGVYNAGVHRIDEYTPTRARGGSAAGHGGAADLYGKMLVEELKPYVDAHYRTLTDAAHTGLGGSSLGGLVSLYLGLKYPNVFGRLACLSTSAWWDGETIVRDVAALPEKTDARIWLDVGGAEGEDAVGPVRHLRDALIARGWTPGKDMAYEETPNASHNEDAWAARFGRVLTFLFPATQK